MRKMHFDPYTGRPTRMIPITSWHDDGRKWRFNPFNGIERTAKQIRHDPRGLEYKNELGEKFGDFQPFGPSVVCVVVDGNVTFTLGEPDPECLVIGYRKIELGEAFCNPITGEVEADPINLSEFSSDITVNFDPFTGRPMGAVWKLGAYLDVLKSTTHATLHHNPFLAKPAPPVDLAKAPSAPDLLKAAEAHMRDRAATYDRPEGAVMTEPEVVPAANAACIMALELILKELRSGRELQAYSIEVTGAASTNSIAEINIEFKK